MQQSPPLRLPKQVALCAVHSFLPTLFDPLSLSLTPFVGLLWWEFQADLVDAQRVAGERKAYVEP
jgi:hypothetical protein